MKTLSANTEAAQKGVAVDPIIVSPFAATALAGWERVQGAPTSDQYPCAAVYWIASGEDADRGIQVVNAEGTLKVRNCALNGGIFDEAWTTLATTYTMPTTAPVAVGNYSGRLILAYVHMPTIDTERVSTFYSTDGETWHTDADLYTTSTGRTIGGLGAAHGGVFWADNGASTFVIDGAIWNGSSWSGIAAASSETVNCRGLGVAYNVDDQEYLCLYNVETSEAVQYLNSRIWDGSAWSSPARAFNNYLESKGDLGYPAVTWDIYNAVYLATYSHYDRRGGTNVYRTMFSVGHESGTRWREPWPTVDLEVQYQSAVVFDDEQGDLFWLMSSRDVVARVFPDSPALSSVDLPLVRYKVFDEPVSGRGGGLHGEAWFFNAQANIDQTFQDLVGRTVGIMRRIVPNLEANSVIRLPDLFIVEQNVYALGQDAALIHVKLRDSWHLFDRQAPTRVRWVNVEIGEIFADLVWMVKDRIQIVTDGDAVWSRVVPEFVLRSQETYSAAILRLMSLVGGRLRFGITSGNERALFVTSATEGSSVYTYGDGADAHPLRRGSYLASRIVPTIHQVYGAGGIYSVDILWDQLAAGEPGSVSGLRSTVWDTQSAVDEVAGQLGDGALRSRSGGRLVILPNVGQELGDVVTIQHSLYNGGIAVTRTVTGITEEYDARKGVFQQILDLDDDYRPSTVAPVQVESIDPDKLRLQEMSFGRPGLAVALVNGRLRRTQTHHVVASETGTTDTLTYIAPGEDGDLLLLTFAAGHVITVGGGSNYRTTEESEYLLGGNDGDMILFAYDGRNEEWVELSRSGRVPHHAWLHTDAELGGDDIINGDHLDITYTPTNYTPSTTPAEAFDADDLAAHLYGIDTALGTKAATLHNHAAADITSGILASARGGTGIDNAGRTLTIATNSGTLAFAGAGTTLTIPATGTAALLGVANVFTGENVFNTTTYANTLLSRRTTGSGGAGKLVAARFVAKPALGASASDGYGPLIEFDLDDAETTGGPLATVGAIRDGADNSGAFVVQTVTLGTYTDRLIIKNNGNVGIGTTSPITLLHLSGVTTALLLGNESALNIDVDKENNVRKGIMISNDANSWVSAAAVGGIVYIDQVGGTAAGEKEFGLQAYFRRGDGGSASKAGRLRLYKQNDATPTYPTALGFAPDGVTDVFTIRNSGNVGIGTTSPSTLLHLSGVTTAVPIIGNESALNIDVDKENNVRKGIMISNDANSWASPAAVGGIVYIDQVGGTAAGEKEFGLQAYFRRGDGGSASKAGRLRLYKENDATGTYPTALGFAPDGVTDVFTIRNSGNVLIGTTTNQGQLTVDQSSTTAAEPVLVLDQADLSEEFIEFISTIGAGNPIDTAALGAYYGKVRVAVNGTFKWLALYD